jgi:hypothetical protein
VYWSLRNNRKTRRLLSPVVRLCLVWKFAQGSGWEMGNQGLLPW